MVWTLTQLKFDFVLTFLLQLQSKYEKQIPEVRLLLYRLTLLTRCFTLCVRGGGLRSQKITTPWVSIKKCSETLCCKKLWKRLHIATVVFSKKLPQSYCRFFLVVTSQLLQLFLSNYLIATVTFSYLLPHSSFFTKLSSSWLVPVEFQFELGFAL